MAIFSLLTEAQPFVDQLMGCSKHHALNHGLSNHSTPTDEPPFWLLHHLGSTQGVHKGKSLRIISALRTITFTKPGLNRQCLRLRATAATAAESSLPAYLPARINDSSLLNSQFLPFALNVNSFLGYEITQRFHELPSYL